MSPSFSPDFVDKLWLAVIDKLALGAVVIFLGYLVNRHLEAVKSREGVRKVMLERRINTLLEQWGAVRGFRFDTIDWASDAWMKDRGVTSRASAEPAPAMDHSGSSPPAEPAGAASLVQRATKLNNGIRDHKGLLGKTITDAMYQVVGVHLALVENVREGNIPDDLEPPSPDFEWLESVLDAPDLEKLPHLTREKKLAASRAAFLRKHPR